MADGPSGSGREAGGEQVDAAGSAGGDESLRGAVIAAVVPGQPARVITQAGLYAELHGSPLVVVHVDVSRFVTYEDPDGYVHSAPIDMNIEAGAADLETVRDAASQALRGKGVEWVTRQLVGDPAIAIKQLADRIDARLIVVGTRKRGIGDTIREFFTGSVAARLAHRQRHNILVVPLGEPVPDDQEIWPS